MKTAKNTTYKKVYDFALQIFGYDKDRVTAWWMQPCNEFDGLSPFEVVKAGNGRKLMRYLERCVL